MWIFEILIFTDASNGLYKEMKVNIIGLLNLIQLKFIINKKPHTVKRVLYQQPASKHKVTKVLHLYSQRSLTNIKDINKN